MLRRVVSRAALCNPSRPHYLGAAGPPGYGPGGHGFRQLLYVRDGLHSSAQHVLETIPSDIYVRAPGCYAIQVDGEGLSETLVFRAVP